MSVKDRLENHIDGILKTSLGDVKTIPTRVSLSEKIENAFVQQGLRRSNHMVTPGLYAIGNPSAQSDVFVTANYKISLDSVRPYFSNNVWVMILDTHGINVWCAAGKGTFATTELIRMINKCGLGRLISHRNIIVPQLGATGVSAHAVTQATGFKVVYGPVRAEDLPIFVENDYKASKEMRKVTFSLKERMILSPLEVFQSLRFTLAAWCILLIIGILGQFTIKDINIFVQIGVSLLAATLVGTVVFHLMFNKLVGKMFTVKVLPLSSLYLMLSFLYLLKFELQPISALSVSLIGVGLIELFALNFTGATPVASYSETKEETNKVIPFIGGIVTVGLILYVLAIWQGV